MGNALNRNGNNDDNNANYRYNQNGNGLYFGDHFVMGGQEFGALEPEAFLFGEMADLDFLSRMPGVMNRPPPNIKHTNSMRCLLFLNKETIKLIPQANTDTASDTNVSNGAYHLDFKIDADAPCSVTVHFFATEEIDNDGGISFKSRLSWPTFQYAAGHTQPFSHHECTIANLDKYADKDLFYQVGSNVYPIVIHVVTDTGEGKHHSLATYATFDKSNSGNYIVRPLVQKANVNGLSLVLKEIFGIEKKEQAEDGASDLDDEDDNTECVVCMSQAKDTMALPCRHLCLCNPCADVLRYQANKCPICRAPFHSLLQIRVLKPEDEITRADDDEEEESDDVPPGFGSISLAEAVSNAATDPNPIPKTEEPEGYLMVESAPSTPNKRLSLADDTIHQNNEDAVQPMSIIDNAYDDVIIQTVPKSGKGKAKTQNDEEMRSGGDGTDNDLPSSSAPVNRSGNLSNVNFHNYPSDERLEMESQVVWSSKEGAESDVILASRDKNAFNLPGTPDLPRSGKSSPSADTRKGSVLEI